MEKKKTAREAEEINERERKCKGSSQEIVS